MSTRVAAVDLSTIGRFRTVASVRVPGWSKRFLRVWLSLGVVVLLWVLSAEIAHQPTEFYPTPQSVARAAVDLWAHGVIPSYVGASLERWSLGLLIGVAAAIPMALLLSLSRTAAAMVMPLLNFFHAIVELAWIPLFVLWFGYSGVTIELSIAYVVFFLVLYNTVVGIEQVPRTTINALRTLGANRWQVTREVLLPGAMPNIITGLRLAAGFAWRSLIGAEMIAAQSGLGFLIFKARQEQNTSGTVVGMVAIGVLWLAIDRFYLSPIEQMTVERWGLVGSSR